GWRVALTYSSSRRRPVSGENIIMQDPEIECGPLSFNPVAFQQCLERVRLNPPDDALETPGTIGRPIFVAPPLSSLSSSLSFNLTPKWAASWQTSYDFRTSEFATHVVSLQRELHDWMANFSFTRTPMGAFSFSFFISQKADADSNFDYTRQSYRGNANSSGGGATARSGQGFRHRPHARASDSIRVQGARTSPRRLASGVRPRWGGLGAF